MVCTYQSKGGISSIVDESLVHSHGSSEFEPRHRTSFYIYKCLFIYLCNCLNNVHNQLRIILLAEYETVHTLLSWCIRLLNMKQSISYWVDVFGCWIWNSPCPIALMHSVAEYETVHILLSWCILLLNMKQSISYWIDASVAEYETVHTLLSWCIRLLNMKQSISYWVYAFCSILHMRSRVCLCRI